MKKGSPRHDYLFRFVLFNLRTINENPVLSEAYLTPLCFRNLQERREAMDSQSPEQHISREQL